MTRKQQILRLFHIIIIVFITGSLAAQEPWSAPSPKHEVRAVWLTTLSGLDWPRTYDIATQQQQLQETLDKLKAAGVNTVLFQARTRAMALYPSAQEPWDACLTGAGGRSPGYDPLQFCIDECHKRGMECHAWVVTIPVGKWNGYGCQQLRKLRPKLLKRIGEDAFLDPANEQTATYLASICGDITRRYDVDGIHLDYIRYPETWPRVRNAAERSQRRANITGIVRAINYAVKSAKPWVKLSCSPVGKYDDLTRYRAGGWNARNAVSQEAQQWLKTGLMDQLYPMMYFQDNNFFPFAIDWKEQSAGRTVSAGLGIYFLDPREGRWTLDQVQRQMAVSRQVGIGHCYFRSRFLTDNVKGLYDWVCQFDATPALVPPMTWAGQQPPTPPSSVSIEQGKLCWEAGTDRSGGPYLLYNIYASHDFPVDVTRAENLVATRLTQTSVVVPTHLALRQTMNYAVTAMDRFGQESEPAQLLLNAGPRYSAPIIARTDGRPIALPKKPSTLDATLLSVETFQGVPVAWYSYEGKWLSVEGLPDGIYQLRAIGRRNSSHRIGFFTIRRKSTISN